MNIVHLSTWDNIGGAAVAAYRLHNSLLDEGIVSKMFVKNKTENSEKIIRYDPRKNSLLQKFISKLNKNRNKNEYDRYKNKPKGTEFFSSPYVSDKTGPITQLPEADIYHLHWVSNFIDIEKLFLFLRKKGKPVVWTLHDMNPMTGGCHHDDDCGRFAKDCGLCPQLNSSDIKDISNRYFKAKKKAYNLIPHNKILIAPDSHWLAGHARKSSLFENFAVQTVHYGIDTDTLSPIDKVSAKRSLDIDGSCFTILFGAANISNKRKGFHFLADALNILSQKHPSIALITYGNNPPEISLNLPYKHIGSINNLNFARIIDSAADLFVIPSVREAFGQTCLEAFCCGTPAVGFRQAGGITDMIENGITGYLANDMNAQSLAAEMEKIITMAKGDYLTMSANCRQMAVNEYALKIQAGRYNEIYKNLLAK